MATKTAKTSNPTIKAVFLLDEAGSVTEVAGLAGAGCPGEPGRWGDADGAADEVLSVVPGGREGVADEGEGGRLGEGDGAGAGWGGAADWAVASGGSGEFTLLTETVPPGGELSIFTSMATLPHRARGAARWSAPRRKLFHEGRSNAVHPRFQIPI
jgi:hypothetical protein